jgi:hypothetical protein
MGTSRKGTLVSPQMTTYHAKKLRKVQEVREVRRKIGVIAEKAISPRSAKQRSALT